MLTNSNPVDTELLLRLKEGDQEAFEHLYNSHGKRIYWKIARMVKIKDEAEELFQELFVRVWERREQIDVQQSFSAYLYRIAENMVYDFYRKATRTEGIRQILIARGEESYDHIEKTLFKKEAHELLHQAIATMPPLRQQAFILCKLEEKSYEEVAAIMGISTNTVRNHIVKGTQTLKEYFRDHQNPNSMALILLFLTFF